MSVVMDFVGRKNEGLTLLDWLQAHGGEAQLWRAMDDAEEAGCALLGAGLSEAPGGVYDVISVMMLDGVARLGEILAGYRADGGTMAQARADMMQGYGPEERWVVGWLLSLVETRRRQEGRAMTYSEWRAGDRTGVTGADLDALRAYRAGKRGCPASEEEQELISLWRYLGADGDPDGKREELLKLARELAGI